MRISFELSPGDVEHFRQLLQKSAAAAEDLGETKVLEAAEELLRDVDEAHPTGFIGERMAELRTMIAMLRDQEFDLAAEFRTRVVAALAYFADPHDLIPDDVPGLGYLDDAIMVEIVRLELVAELEAYREFCSARGEEAEGRARNPEAYATVLGEKRARLFERLRERRNNLNDWG